MKVGDRVRYIGDEANGMYYPPTGTFGTVVWISPSGLHQVRWDSGTVPGAWYCMKEMVEVVHGNHDVEETDLEPSDMDISYIYA